jgi:hypothetical protein
MLNGEDAVFAHYNLNKKLSDINNNPSLKSTSDNFYTVRKNLIAISEQSMIEQEVRMEREAEQGRTLQKNFAEINNKVQLKLQNEFKKISQIIQEDIYYGLSIRMVHSDIAPKPFNPQEI